MEVPWSGLRRKDLQPTAVLSSWQSQLQGRNRIIAWWGGVGVERVCTEVPRFRKVTIKLEEAMNVKSILRESMRISSLIFVYLRIVLLPPLISMG